jgi:NADPH-dependent 2,4-dienoyl-CoA reductase/sulfur reductase-like enzyme
MTTSGSGTVIVGASVAGIATADALRKNGYRAPIRVLDALSVVPHNKPPLSKQALDPGHDDARLALRPQSYFTGLQIELMLGRRAVALSAGGPRIHLDDGPPLDADDVVLATGAAPRPLPGGQAMPGVHVIRSLPDAAALRRSLDGGPRVVIAGCGFIGAETAAAARKRGLEVTVAELAPHPFEALVGREPAAALTRLHREHGVRLLAGAGVAGVEGAGRVQAVLLADGRRLPADVLVLGLGVLPSVGWLAGSGIRLGPGIVCDRYGRTSVPHVWAAGDAAAWPDPFSGEPRRIEHWTTAQQHGTSVGHNIARPDDVQTVPAVPYFWSDQYGSRMQSLGWLDSPDEIRCVHGDWDAAEFVAVYRRGDRVAGAFGLNAARQLMPWRIKIEKRVRWSDATGTSAPIGMIA